MSYTRGTRGIIAGFQNMSILFLKNPKYLLQINCL